MRTRFLAAAIVPAIGFLAPAGAASDRPQTPRRTVTTLYFLTPDGAAPIGVRRTLPRQSPQARQALEALLAGPTPAEGVLTVIPADVRLRSLVLEPRRRGSDALVDLTGLPPAAGVPPGRRPSVLLHVRVLTQIARTLIGLSDIARVRVRVDGRPWDLPGMDGRLRDRPTDYERLRGWTRICAGQRTPGERAAGLSRCFAALP